MIGFLQKPVPIKIIKETIEKLFLGLPARAIAIGRVTILTVTVLRTMLPVVNIPRLHDALETQDVQVRDDPLLDGSQDGVYATERSRFIVQLWVIAQQTIVDAVHLVEPAHLLTDNADDQLLGRAKLGPGAEIVC
jgi:hypothetical protein